MWFWAFMLAADLLMPLVMIVFGRRFRKSAPREINAVFGYRTARSMQSKETWEFAHRYIGRLWNVCGWLALPASAAAMLPVLGRDAAAVGTVGGAVCGAQIVLLIATLFPTERALKKRFGSDGWEKGR